MSGKSSRPLVRLTNTQSRLRLSEVKIRRLAVSILRILHHNAELHVTLMSDRRIQSLNRKFHSQNRATDVLAFQIPARWFSRNHGRSFLGEVIISPNQAKIYSKTHDVPFKEELVRYVCHGILHLSGYSDHSKHAQMKMRRAEDRLLRLVTRQINRII